MLVLPDPPDIFSRTLGIGQDGNAARQTDLTAMSVAAKVIVHTGLGCLGNELR